MKRHRLKNSLWVKFTDDENGFGERVTALGMQLYLHKSNEMSDRGVLPVSGFAAFSAGSTSPPVQKQQADAREGFVVGIRFCLAALSASWSGNPTFPGEE